MAGSARKYNAVQMCEVHRAGGTDQVAMPWVHALFTNQQNDFLLDGCAEWPKFGSISRGTLKITISGICMKSRLWDIFKIGHNIKS